MIARYPTQEATITYITSKNVRCSSICYNVTVQILQ